MLETNPLPMLTSTCIKYIKHPVGGSNFLDPKMSPWTNLTVVDIVVIEDWGAEEAAVLLVELVPVLVTLAT
ncbi:hypothetical protein E2C01_020441 [Portunus trituberculatus]|uniref:Uncharacterized protein n=1 Tax=Portunus trituberculatus TaxID=210409 RepID=A0A5B7E220_PORTR|nr:hypothetical protein [Portunus trituberculatus]